MLEVFRPAFAAVFADIVESPLKFIETLVNRLSGSFWLSLRCVTKQHDDVIRTLILRSVVAIPRFQCEDSVAELELKHPQITPITQIHNLKNI